MVQEEKGEGSGGTLEEEKWKRTLAFVVGLDGDENGFYCRDGPAPAGVVSVAKATWGVQGLKADKLIRRRVGPPPQTHTTNNRKTKEKIMCQAS